MNNDINNSNNINGVNNSTNSSSTSIPDVATTTTVLQDAPTTNTMQIGTPPPVHNSSTSNEGGQILCDKCGMYFPSNQRYCMKCGALNYSHPDNQSMKQYINYDVVNHNYVGNYKDKLSHNTIDPEIAEKRNCLWISILLHVVLAALFVWYFSIMGIMSAGIIGVIALICIFLFVLDYSMCLIYIIAGEKWWYNYIPFYSTFVFYKITMDSGFFMFLSGIPIVPLIAYYNLGVRFERNGWLTMLFMPIMIPYIAFTSTSYGGSLKSMHMNISTDVDAKGRTRSERSYGVKKKIFAVVVLVSFTIFMYFAYPYIIKYGKMLIDFLIDNFNEFKKIIDKYN